MLSQGKRIIQLFRHASLFTPHVSMGAMLCAKLEGIESMEELLQGLEAGVHLGGSL